MAEVGIRPNWISLSSVGFAALAFYGFWVARGLDLAPFKGSLGLVLVMLGIAGRLMANLLDGLVAVEGGVESRHGAYWNEVPDRVSDLLILAGFGLVVEQAWLGLLAGALAVMIAYIREFGARVTGHMDFSGPMAKQHRMMLTLASCGLAFLWLFFDPATSPQILLWGLWLLIAGSALTLILRSWRMMQRLD